MLPLPQQTINKAVEAGKMLGSVAGGFILANVAKVTFLEPSSEGKTLLEDKTLYNGIAAAASIGGAIFVKNTYARLALAGFGTYFTFRTANKIVNSLKGLGDDGAPSKIKEYLQKYLPNLSGLGEISMPVPMQLPMQNYLPEASTTVRRTQKVATWD